MSITLALLPLMSGGSNLRLALLIVSEQGSPLCQASQGMGSVKLQIIHKILNSTGILISLVGGAAEVCLSVSGQAHVCQH